MEPLTATANRIAPRRRILGWRDGLLLALAVSGGLSLPAQSILLHPRGQDAVAVSTFGDYVKTADVDRDGHADLVVGDWQHRERRGGIWLYRGGPSGLATEPSWSLEGSSPNEELGHGLEVLDVNLDGWPDLVVVRLDGVSTDPTAVTLGVFKGSSEGFGRAVTTTWRVQSPGLALPHRYLATADVSGDGHPDLLCGGGDSRIHPNGLPCVFAFFARTNGLAAEPDWRIDGQTPGESFGFIVTDAGDVDGDGHRDLLVGAPWYPGGGLMQGRAYLFPGTRTGTSAYPDWIAEYPLSVRQGFETATEFLFGFSIAGVGDVNGDGMDDVAIGAPYADHDDIDEGMVFVYFGSKQGLSRRPDVVLEGDQGFSVLGHCLAAVGDVDRDGFSDFAVSAPTVTADQAAEGVVALFRGTRQGAAPQPAWVRMSDRSHWRLGMRLVAGDFNGDGQADLASTASNPGKAVAVFAWDLTPKSMSESANWRLGKPWHRRLEQWWGWRSSRERWGIGTGLAMLALTGILFGVRHRLRSRRETNEAVVRERARIARDLHDELGTHLSRLRHGTTIDPDGADSASAVTVGIERVIWSLHPERRSLDDFACGLMDLTENVLGDTSIRARFEFPSELPSEILPSETLGALYRASQEALTNLRKHSGANEARIMLEVLPESLCVTIADDGKGAPEMPPVQVDGRDGLRRGGHGLANMAARLHEIGGQFEWLPSEPTGVRVRFTAPRGRRA